MSLTNDSKISDVFHIFATQLDYHHLSGIIKAVISKISSLSWESKPMAPYSLLRYSKLNARIEPNYSQMHISYYRFQLYTIHPYVAFEVFICVNSYIMIMWTNLCCYQRKETFKWARENEYHYEHAYTGEKERESEKKLNWNMKNENQGAIHQNNQI